MHHARIGILVVGLGLALWLGTTHRQDLATLWNGIFEKHERNSHESTHSGTDSEVSKSSASGEQSKADARNREDTDQSLDIQSEKLTSIYATKVKAASTDTEPRQNSNKKNSNVFGVPVESWALSRQDAVHMHMPPAEKGVRVYLQCIEFKGSSVSVVENEEVCKDLYAVNPDEPRPGRWR